MNKSIVFMTLIMFTYSISAFAQDDEKSEYEISDITLASGKSSLGEGIIVTTTVTDQKNYFVFQASQDFAIAIFGKPIGNFFAGVSGGFFFNTPHIGPYVEFDFSNFKLIHWSGVSTGKGGSPSFRPEDAQIFFIWHRLKRNFGNFSVTATVLHYEDSPADKQVGAGYNLSLSDKISVGMEAEYSITTEEPFFSGSISYNF